MNPNRLLNIRRFLIGINNEVELELDRNPTTCELWQWFRALPEGQQNQIRREIIELKIEQQKSK